MISDPSLAGQAILILEDDIVQAFDLEHVLSSVGARVVGPFSKECYAIEANRIGRLSAAIIDVNLGRGNSFETAHALQDAAERQILLFLGHLTHCMCGEMKPMGELSVRKRASCL
jgi:ActR/RegA family two-component response regulator